MAQSEIGQIKILDDFLGGTEAAVAGTTAPPIARPPYFYIVGQGIADTDSGMTHLDSDGISGVAQFLTTDEDVHCAGLQTPTMFDVGLQGTIVMEVRVRHAAITAALGETFIGFSDVNTDLAIIEGAICHGDTITVTLTASDLVGFLLAGDLTDSADWHMVYNGGSTTGETTSTSIDATAEPTATEMQVLRVEVDNNGTARWYVDGVLKQTKIGAVSTTAVFGGCAGVVSTATGTVSSVTLDYLAVEANRDWTV